MLIKLFRTASLALLCCLIFSNCSQSRKDSVHQRGELVVAMDPDMPGYFVLGGESYGYQYELFQAYADYLGVDLRVVSGSYSSRGAASFDPDSVDIVTTLTSHVTESQQALAVPIYQTSYVVLSSKKRAAEARKIKDFSLIPFLRDHRLLVSAGLQDSQLYRSLVDSLSAEHVFVSSRNSFDMMELLGSGEYDFLICEMSEAQLGTAMVRNVEQLYTFTEPVSMSAVVAPHGSDLKEDFCTWLEKFRGSEEYAMLNDLYFDRGIVGRLMGTGLTTTDMGAISSYDDLFRDISEKEGYDWRLLSAIAYSESRFNPDVISRKGARGLMQVMPRVARQFGIKGDLMDPENNILLAIRVLAKIEKSLDFSTAASQTDRLKIMLACYNAGVGHVLDARSLARKNGANPDAWSDVSQYLSMKSDPEVVKDDAVKCGRFNSSQTVAFVDKVYTKYTAYCRNIRR